MSIPIPHRHRHRPSVLSVLSFIWQYSIFTVVDTVYVTMSPAQLEAIPRTRYSTVVNIQGNRRSRHRIYTETRLVLNHGHVYTLTFTYLYTECKRHVWVLFGVDWVKGRCLHTHWTNYCQEKREREKVKHVIEAPSSLIIMETVILINTVYIDVMCKLIL